MQVSLESSFTAYKLTQQEEQSGYTFNEANKAVIQNLISAAAEDFVAVGLQCNSVELTMEERLRLAELQGQVKILKHLLQTADAVKEQIEMLQNKINNQDQNPL